MTKRTDSQTVAILKKSAIPTNLFHIPETKEDMDAWIKNMSSSSPTGIAVMVGYNYAMRQVQRILDGEL
jgi:hypothetical protein